MRSSLFGSTKRPVPVVGQGTWHIERSAPRAAVAALQRGLECGMRHIDTAEYYGAGRSEAVVARALEGRRDEAFLVSKVMPSNARYDSAVEACERSLRFLKTDRLDCYLLHWRGRVPLAETFQAFEALQAQGKILSWGVSNFDEEDLAEALALVGPGQIACNQVLYHLKERAVEHAVVPFCQENGIAVVGYTPFGTSEFPPPGLGGSALQKVAKRHGATPRQVALAFLTRGEGVFAIPKSGQAAHTEENAGGGSLALASEDIVALDAAFPRGPRRSGIPML